MLQMKLNVVKQENFSALSQVDLAALKYQQCAMVTSLVTTAAMKVLQHALEGVLQPFHTLTKVSVLTD